MHWMGALVYAVAALWLLPTSWWRPVALALLIQWALAEVAYEVWGDFIPLPVYLVGDCAVIVTAWLWRSHWTDWLVIAPYPYVWFLYGTPETRDQWTTLYWIALAQFVMAGPWVQARREVTIFGEFAADLTGFIRSRLSRVIVRTSAG